MLPAVLWMVHHPYVLTVVPSHSPPLSQESPSQQQIEQALEEAAANASQGGSKQSKEIKITLESSEGQQDKKVKADKDR